MKLKKLIALLLCIVMMMSALTGCKTTVDDVVDEYAADETSTRDYDAGRAAYDADEIVMTVDGKDITWDEYFNWVCYALDDYESTYGPITDFTTPTAIGTISDTIVDSADYLIAMYKGVEKKADELGIDYSGNIDDELQEYLDEILAQLNGDEEALEELIRKIYGTREMFEYTYKIDSLSPDMFEYYYGIDGIRLTDAQLEEGSEEYLMAKHILIQTTDEATGLVLEEEDLKAAQDKIEMIYAQLEAYEGDDLEGFFDQLTEQYTEDEGFLTYPDGYLFQEGDMVNEFYNAALSVEEGQYSEIVESAYGYHIVMRLPIDYDATPMRYLSYGFDASLRYIIANSLFREEYETWIDNVDVKYTDFHDTIDLAQVFPVEE